MAHVSKRRKAFVSRVDRNKAYPAMEALKLVKDTATAKFDEAVDVAVNLGIDAKKGEQTVRGSVVLPAGTGKKVRIAVFAPGDKAEAAKAAGADVVGMSTVHELMAAHHMGAQTIGISCVSNWASGLSAVPLDHKHVAEVAGAASSRFVPLVERIIATMPMPA